MWHKIKPPLPLLYVRQCCPYSLSSEWQGASNTETVGQEEGAEDASYINSNLGPYPKYRA